MIILKQNDYVWLYSTPLLKTPIIVDVVKSNRMMEFDESELLLLKDGRLGVNNAKSLYGYNLKTPVEYRTKEGFQHKILSYMFRVKPI